MIHRISLIIVLAYIVGAIAWDVGLAAVGKCWGNSWCEACRELNRSSDGLIALCGLALWVHVFLLPWLPEFWRHP